MKIIAHRGASGYQPENTLAAFSEAIKLAVDMIELDVYVVRTGELVVIHDTTVDRTTNSSGKITTMGLEEIKKLDAGNGERIPLLSEVLDLVDGQVGINIELKGPGTAHPVAKLLERYITAKGWSADQFMVSSFSHRELLRFVKIMPNIRAGALFNRVPFLLSPITYRKDIHSVNLNVAYLTKKDIIAAHAIGKKVYAYTVNTPVRAAKLQSAGIDGIFTNYPDILTKNHHPTSDASRNAVR